MKNRRTMTAMTAMTAVIAGMVLMVFLAASPASAGILQSSGKIRFLRVHNVGSGFGPPSDFLDVEAVVQLNTKPGESYGFKLRNDANQAAHQGMLDLLRDAFTNNHTVAIDYDVQPPKKNGIIIRVALIK